MRVVYWGVYDPGKPRVRIQLAGLRAAGVTVIECHADVWAGIEDKTRLRRGRDRARLLGRWLRSYPRLLWQYLRAPPHDAVIVGYPGYLDVLVVWPFARLRGARLIWDAFLSLYNTTVEDRRLVRSGALARAVYGWEWLACRAADRLLLDTRAHADYFRRRFNLPATRLSAVFVGVEPEWFPPCPERPPTAPGGELTVLFYGQFIPLHGVLAGRLTDQALVAAILQQRSRCYRSVQASYVIESNYQWYGLLGPLRQALPRCKIALITRDPRTWVRSRINSGAHVYQDAAERLGHQRVNPPMIGDPVYAHQWERMTPFEKTCWDWQFIHSLIKAHAARDPAARLFRYEDLFLSAERQHHVAELLAFLTTFPAGTMRTGSSRPCLTSG